MRSAELEVLKKSKKRWWKAGYEGEVYRLAQGEVVCSDAVNFLGFLADECADIIFLDPPFNLGKAYGRRTAKQDRVRKADYLDFMSNLFAGCLRVLKPGGALFLYHIPRWAIPLAAVLNEHLAFRHWIAISMKNGFVRGNYLYPAHYALLYYTKGRPAHFRRPKVPLSKCRHCNGLIKDYGGYAKYVEGGINLSDIWDDISPVRHKKYKHRRANELPCEIARRVVGMAGLIVDPFVGTGTMLLAAKDRRMAFVACDIDATSARVAADRVALHPSA